MTTITIIAIITIKISISVIAILASNIIVSITRALNLRKARESNLRMAS